MRQFHLIQLVCRLFCRYETAAVSNGGMNEGNTNGEFLFPGRN